MDGRSSYRNGYREGCSVNMTVRKRLISVSHWIIIAILLSSSFVVSTPVRADENPCLKADAQGCSFGLPSFQYEALLGQMLAYPTPDVHPLQIDTTELGHID